MNTTPNFDLMDNPFSELDDDKLLPKASVEIFTYIDETLNNRQQDRNVNRASAASLCPRKRWYKHHGYDGDAFNPRMLLVFAFGDLVEYAMKYFIKQACVGDGKLYSEVVFGNKTGSFVLQGREFEIYDQHQVITSIDDGVNNLIIPGHADGWGKRNSDQRWELIEIKSAASASFDKFKRGEVPDYIKQIHCLMMSDFAFFHNVRETRFFYMNKNTSHVFDKVFVFNESTAKQVRDEYLMVLNDEIPNRPYDLQDEVSYRKTTGRKILSYPCSYCEFKKTCWPGIKKEFKSGRPVWYLE